MNEALVKFMSAVGITTYVPTEQDYMRLICLNRKFPEPNTPEAELEELILRIYHFDYYYDYAVDATVVRDGRAAEQSIIGKIETIKETDPELGKFLQSSFGPNKRDKLVVKYPWLTGYRITSPLAELVKNYELSVSEASNLMAIGKFINHQIDELRARHIDTYTVYAKNKAAVRAHIIDARNRGALPAANPVTLPNDLYRIWGHIGALLEEHGVYPVLKSLVHLQVHYFGTLTRYTVGNATLFM